MVGTGIYSPEDRRFVGQADGIIDDILAREPVHATEVGDHRFDARLPDLTVDGVDEYVQVLTRYQHFLRGVDDRAMSRITVADLQILRAGVARRIFEYREIAPHRWNPMLWNPGDALLTLVDKPFAPAAVRARALRARLEAVPAFLENARHTLGQMPEVHIRTAMDQLSRIEPMLRESVGALADEAGVGEALQSATTALDEHIGWLGFSLELASRDTSLGPTLYRGVLSHFLETQASADAVLDDAWADLDRVTDELASLSAKYSGGSMADKDVITKALDSLGDVGAPVSADTIVHVCNQHLSATKDFLAERDLVTVPQIDARIELMPPPRRGVAVAYCDPPGGLESAELPTKIGIAPAPATWSDTQIASYYREYNEVMLADLMVHEGLPGHVLQTALSRDLSAPTSVRAAMPSGLFVEGWAVYAEALMARSGFMVDGRWRQAFRLAQLKMQLRMILNTILEISYHAKGMGQREALDLMQSRGFQTEGEALGKWRRVQLTYGQLPTYYLGYRGVSAVVRDLQEARRGWSLRQVHDAVLSHGSVSPKHLRALVGVE